MSSSSKESITVKLVFGDDCRRIPLSCTARCFDDIVNLALDEFDVIRSVGEDENFSNGKVVFLKYTDEQGDNCTLSHTTFNDWLDEKVKVQRTLRVVLADCNDMSMNMDDVVGFIKSKNLPSETGRLQSSWTSCKEASVPRCGGIEGYWRNRCNLSEEEIRKRKEAFATFAEMGRNFFDTWRSKMDRNTCVDTVRSAPATVVNEKDKPFEPKGPKPIMALLRVMAKNNVEIEPSLLAAASAHFLPNHIPRIKNLLKKIRNSWADQEFEELSFPSKKFAAFSHDASVILSDHLDVDCTFCVDKPTNVVQAIGCIKALELLLEELSMVSFKKRVSVCRAVAKKLAARKPMLHSFLKNSEFLSCVPELNMNDVTHSTVRCDGCNTQPIVGLRFKCNECPNFDFCHKCYVEGPTGAHDPTHSYACMLRKSLASKRPNEFLPCPPPECSVEEMGMPSWCRRLQKSRGMETERCTRRGMMSGSSGDEMMNPRRCAMRRAMRRGMMSGSSGDEMMNPRRCAMRRGMMSGSSGDEMNSMPNIFLPPFMASPLWMEMNPAMRRGMMSGGEMRRGMRCSV